MSPRPDLTVDYSAACLWASRLVARDDIELVDLDRACGDDKALQRLVRHLWVLHHQRIGVSCYALAKKHGLPSRTVEHWAIKPERCSCGSPRSPNARSCDPCARRARIRWTKDLLIAERDRYLDVHGRMPRSSDWNATRNPNTAADWPPASTVTRRFGSWPAFLLAESDAMNPRDVIAAS